MGRLDRAAARVAVERERDQDLVIDAMDHRVSRGFERLDLDLAVPDQRPERHVGDCDEDLDLAPLSGLSGNQFRDAGLGEQRLSVS